MMHLMEDDGDREKPIDLDIQRMNIDENEEFFWNKSAGPEYKTGQVVNVPSVSYSRPSFGVKFNFRAELFRPCFLGRKILRR